LGYVIGSRRSRRELQTLQLEMNRCNLDLLDSRAEAAALARAHAQQPRKDRLLVFVMKRLKRLEKQQIEHERTLSSEKNRQFARVARLQLALIEAREKGQRARALATRAMAHLRRLEGQLPETQTIRCPTPKSYGSGEAVTVSVVDQRNEDAKKDSVTRVSNRDSARLTRLRSSNEGHRYEQDNLQAIQGIDDKTERSLNSAGIHRFDQLANLSKEDMDQLRQTLEEEDAKQPSSEWVGDARELLRQKLPMI